MANNKKATPGTVQYNRLISELPEKREKYKLRFNSDMTF